MRHARDDRGAGWRAHVGGPLAWAAAAAVAAGCSDEKTPPTAAADVQADSKAGADSAGPTDTAAQDVEDAAVGADGADASDQGGADAAVDGAKDGGDVAGPCISDDQCAKFAVKKCEMPVCDKASGLCVGTKDPSKCCGDDDCKSLECTNKKCNLDTAQCEYDKVLNCCAGQEILLKLDFEQKSLEGFTSTDGPTNGNVKWKIESKRAHKGKYALYFGNECYTYDASMTEQIGCQGGGTGGAVSTKLKSTTLNLTPGKQFILHFWLWLASEPSWLKELAKGTCTPPCAPDAVCVNDPKAGGQPLCLLEKDVLKLAINGNPIDWNSVAIGKTTGGEWQHIAVDLAKYAGQGISISWEFNTGNGLKNAFEGIYLDDIRVETLCATADNTCDAVKKCKAPENACATDSCTAYVNGSGGAGFCFGNKVPGCCSGAVDCDDNNNCTIDTCAKAAGADKGTCKNVPNAASDQCCKPDSLAADNFTNGLSTWTLTENSKTVKWQVHPTGGTAGSPALYFGDATFASYDDPSLKPQGPTGVACSKTIKLPAGTLYNIATFQLNLSTEWDLVAKDKYKNPPLVGEPKVDEFKVLVKSAGQYCGLTDCKAPGAPLPAGLWSSDAIQGSTGGKWLPLLVSLDKFAGKDVQVCFSFEAGDSTANKAKGALVDDFEVKVTCTEAPCIADSQCAGKCAPCEAGVCQDSACYCKKIEGCCANDAGCDDGDTCTTDKCDVGKCSHTLNSPTCCSNKTVVNEAFDKSNGKLPDGWKASTLKGQPPVGGGKPYSTLVSWTVTPLKNKTPSYSLYFGTNGVTYDTGPEVPAAVVRSGDVTIPKNGTTLLTFQLYLSTEWNPPADPNWVFKAPPEPIYTDRLRIGGYDVAEPDPVKASSWWWSSYSIEGSTNGKWQSVVIPVPDTWKGKTVKLQFEFDAGTTANNKFEGAFIDDLQLATLCTEPVCLSDAKCLPAKPDPCKKYICTKDPKELLFSCMTDFKGGPGCCAPTVAVPTETFEGGKLAGSQWVPSGGGGKVGWTVVPKKYGNASFEAYFGNPTRSTYDDDGKPVAGSLALAKAATLNLNPKNAAFLQFKLYLDIEASWEAFEVRVSIPGAGVAADVVWSHANKADFNPATEMKQLVEKKVDLAKYKGKGEILVEFAFDSKDGKGNAKYQGIFLDDISIQEPCL